MLCSRESAVLFHDGVDSFIFIELKPSCRMRLVIRFVLHGKFLVRPADRVHHVV
jgi:hypothetical protein